MDIYNQNIYVLLATYIPDFANSNIFKYILNV